MSTYQFTTRNTDHECHVEVTTQIGRRKQTRFRNGYAAATISARAWIASQIQDIETECKLSNRPCPDIYVDGVQVVSSNPPTVQQCIDVLRRVATEVNQRGPDSGALFEAACDADELVARYERSLRGKFIPKDDRHEQEEATTRPPGH